MKQSMRTLVSSETNDWCTPVKIIELVNRVLGNIDLDPASNYIANTHIVHATRYYNELDDSLNLDWRGRLFINPPYSKIGNRSSAGVWAEKLLHEYQSGRVESAILLTKTVPGYGWWDNLFNGEWPGSFCIMRGRLSFVHINWIQKDGSIVIPKGKSNISKSASTFWYVGDNAQLFKSVFSSIGRVL